MRIRQSWKTYTNTKNGYLLQYPPSFGIVKGPVPKSELPLLNNISFSGMHKNNDSNGKTIQCTSDDECLTKLMAVLNRSVNEVKFVNKTIMGKDVKGFEYQNKNSRLYTQTSQSFIYLDNEKVWHISITMNNYTQEEVSTTINQILSTFRFD